MLTTYNVDELEEANSRVTLRKEDLTIKKAILVVSYGTAYPDALTASVEALENTFRTSFPDYTVCRAFTGKRIIELLAKQQIYVDPVEEALAKLTEEGYDEIIVQPTHIIAGNEYEKINAAIRIYQSKIPKIRIGTPLLHDRADIETLCRFFAQTYGNAADALVLMGHGSDHAENRLYTAFENVCRTLGYRNLYIATLEASPNIDDVLPSLKEAKAQSVIITPLLFVAGAHACKDMAGGGPDSWKSRLEAEGFVVTPIVKGLGEYEAIRELYTNHLLQTFTS